MSHTDPADRARLFRALHANPKGFVMPNAWDAGSAILFASLGFDAIATTSGGVAFSLGRQDYRVEDPRLAVPREAMFERIGQIVSAVDVPVNGDLEAGYGDDPATVAETIRLAIQAGLAGGNIEDRPPLRDGLYDEALAVERIAAAREAIVASGRPFVLTARTDAFLAGGELKTVVRRGELFRQAGADCIFAPGPTDLATVAALAREIDAPINVVMGLTATPGNAHEILAAGARRISLGASFARAVFGVLTRWAGALKADGSVAYMAEQIRQDELNRLFAGHRRKAA